MAELKTKAVENRTGNGNGNKGMFTFDANGALLRTDLPLELFKRGKVRDTYWASPDSLLIVTTDRISAFDVVLPQGVPDKGTVLNSISQFWFRRTVSIVNNHMLYYEPMSLSFLHESALVLKGRSSFVEYAEPIPFECIARGYLTGSALKEYVKTGSVSGIKLPPGLQESSQLLEPIFTPSTKSESGHDVNITFAELENSIGTERAGMLRDRTIELYRFAHNYALPKGIRIADTKFEFGMDQDSRLTLIDEALTPDSSRFWPVEGYTPGKPQQSFDKQYVRDYLESLHWNKEPPAPDLSSEVVFNTRAKYLTAYETLTGEKLLRS